MKRKDMTLTREDLEFQHYRNSSIAITVKGKVGGKERLIRMTTADAMKIPVVAGLNCLYVSDAGCGKTQALSDITRGYFGGNVGDGGRANWMLGRIGSNVDDIFFNWDKERQIYLVLEDRVRALVNVVDETNRAPGPVQNDYFDLAEGVRVANGHELHLGEDGYALFLASINLNRLNGDFEGVNGIDRALLSRARIGFDLDFYSITDDDEDEVNSRGRSHLMIAEPKDISAKILAAHREIGEKAALQEESLDFYLKIFSRALKYCETDELKTKRANWPGECSTTCPLGEKKSKTIACHLLKHTESRTTQSIKRFVIGMEYLATILEGEPVELDPLDAVFEAAKFTAYHGNLNVTELTGRYKGDNQHMMNATLDRIKKAVTDIKQYIDIGITEAKKGNVCTELVQIVNKTGMKGPLTAKTPETIELMEAGKQQGFSYVTVNPYESLSKIGLGTDWVRGHFERIAKR